MSNFTLHTLIEQGRTADVLTHIEEYPDVVNAKDDSGRAPLTLAACRGYAAVVKALIDTGADLNARDLYGNTALILAVQFGHPGQGTDIVQTLLKHGADLDCQNRYGETAFSLAQRTGHMEFARMIDNAVASKKKTPKQLGGALLAEVRQNYPDIQKVLQLIHRGADINQKDENGRTPLILAVLDNQTEIVKALVAAGANVDACDIPYHHSALTYAAMNGNIEIVSTLISVGANLDHKGREGSTALDIAQRYGHSDIVKLIAQASKQKTAEELQKQLDETIQNASSADLGKLLDAGADPNLPLSHGLTATTLATYYGDAKALKILIDHGADINQPDAKGTLPLTMAKQQRQDVCFKILVEAGAKADAATLKYIATDGAADLVDLLAKHKASVDVRFEDGSTPLMLAIKDCRPLTAQAFIKAGADVTAKNDKGETALSLAKTSHKFGGELERDDMQEVAVTLEKIITQQQQQAQEQRIATLENALADLTAKFNDFTAPKPAPKPRRKKQEYHNGPDGWSSGPSK